MGHCKYVCNKSKRTCFDLGKNFVDEDFKELCELVSYKRCTLDEFIELSEEQIGIFDKKKVVKLYEFLLAIDPNDYAFAHCEDELCEGVFDIVRERQPVKQVDSLYINESTHIFGSWLK